MLSGGLTNRRGKMKKFLVVLLLAIWAGTAFAGTAVEDGASITTDPASLYYRDDGSDDLVTPVSKDDPLPIVNTEAAGTWATARTNVVANDTASVYGTADLGNFSVSGYNHVRFRVFTNGTADSVAFACGTATPVTNPNYGYTATTTITGYSTTAPFTCYCDTNGQTVMFPRFTALSSGANVTAVKYQGYN
jgi:hypothetical protein